MNLPKATAAFAVLFSISACATPGNHVLPPYTLANGSQLQDVVTVAGDPNGGAPSLTVVTTYDVWRKDYTAMLSREFAAGNRSDRKSRKAWR